MQRLIGSVLIITATAGAGYVYGTELKKYLEKIQYLRYISGLLKGEIEYTGATLSEVFSSVAARVIQNMAGTDCRPDKEPGRIGIFQNMEQMHRQVSGRSEPENGALGPYQRTGYLSGTA